MLCIRPLMLLYINAILLPAMSRRWVSALINPFPAGDFKSTGILQVL